MTASPAVETAPEAAVAVTPPPISTSDEAPDQPRMVSSTTEDDRLCLIGAAVGSLGLSWILYTQILPFSGKIGFVIFWFVTYVVMYGSVTALGNPAPIVRDRVWSAIVTGAAVLVGVALMSTVIYTVWKGYHAFLHVNFFTKSAAGVEPTAPLNQGGIIHALVGSAIMLGIATAVSLPLGVGTAVFMVEVGGKFSKVVRTVVEAMTALPDILAGLFIYAVLILALGFAREGFCAGMALSVMMLPIIARSADVALRVVPGGLREASLALGASQWSTVRRVVIPTAKSGLATAVILGMARAVGETAPILITSGASTFFNAHPFNGNEMNSLPLYIFTAVRSGEPAFIERGFGAAMVLLLFVLILFFTARYLSRPRVGR
jgi:phosphate transport system permease protein